MRNNRPSVLIIEDDANLVSVLKSYIESLGFNAQGTYCGRKGLEKALTNKHQLFIIDLGLGDIHGLQLIEQIRNISKKPIIVITGDIKQESEINCYRSKVNIFHRKPIKYEVLSAQIRSLISPRKKGHIFRTRNVYLDLNKRIFKLNDKATNLTRTEFNFLLMLLSSNGEVFTREQIICNVMNYFSTSSENCVDTMVSRIRGKLNEKCVKDSLIQTVNGAGYKLNPNHYKDLERTFS